VLRCSSWRCRKQVQLQQPGYPLHKAAKKRGDNDTLIQVPGMKCAADLTLCARKIKVACIQTRCNIPHHGPCGDCQCRSIQQAYFAAQMSWRCDRLQHQCARRLARIVQRLMDSKTREIAAKDEELQRVKAELQALQVCCPGTPL